MLKHFPKLPSLLVATFNEWRRDNPSLLAASIAYYSFFSIIPFMILTAALGSLFFGKAAVEGQLINTLTQIFGGNVANVIQTALVDTYNQKSSIAVAAAAGLVVFGASFVFVQLRKALDLIWHTHEQKKALIKFVEGRLVSLVMVFGMSILILLWLAITTSLSTVFLISNIGYHNVIAEGLNFLSLFIVTTILFMMMYKLLPSVKLTWEDVGLGATVTGLLFTIGSHAVAFYLSRIGIASVYGVAGSMVVLLMWLYISAQMFLFGVVFTKVFASRHGSHSRKQLARRRLKLS